MPDSILLILALCYLVNAVTSGAAGYAMAVRNGKSVLPAVLLCAVFPWVGVLVLLITTNGKMTPRRTARTTKRVAGAALLATGGVLVCASLLDDWATVSGNADKYKEHFAGGPGDSGSGAITVLILGGFLIGLAVLAWQHGGLRFAVPTAWLVSSIASMLISAVLLSDVLNDVAGNVDRLSAGQAHASIAVGGGAFAALVGSLIACAGAVLVELAAARPDDGVVGFADQAQAVAPVLPVAGTAALAADPWGDMASAPDPWSSPQPTHDPWGAQGATGEQNSPNGGSTLEGW